jgi:uncharacterized delta-60 repeat protein
MNCSILTIVQTVAGLATRAVSLLLILVGGAHAAPGDLDTTFGTAGKVLLNFSSGSNDVAWAIVTDTAGNVYLGGQSTATSTDFAVMRLKANGQLDTSYGTGGKVLVDIGVASTDVGNALALDAAGNLYVAGTTTADGNAQFAVIKLAANGQVDSNFGTSGRAIVASSSPGNESCCSIAIDGDGSIYLVGAAYVSGVQTMKVARLTSAGQTDTTYGTLGIALVLFNHSTNATAAIPDANGNLYVQATVTSVVGGTVGIDMALVQLDHSGQPVTSFGTMGAAYAGFTSTALSANMARDVNGNFYLVGETVGADHIHYDFAVAKLDASGNAVTAFASTGRAIVPISGSNDGSTAFNVVLNADSNLYITGTTVASNMVLTAVVALNGDDGTALTGFGTSGQAVINISGGLYGGVGACLDSSGRLDVVANDDLMSPADFAAIRLETLPANTIFTSGFELP